MKDKDLLREAQERFKEAMDAEADNRAAAIDDLNFLNSDQWDERDRKQRDLDGRPCLTINRLPQFIRQVVNDARQNRPGIRVHPVGGGADTETAEVLQGMIRHIETRSEADVAYDTGIYNAVANGFGYWRVVTDYVSDRSFDQEIRIERIRNPFTVYMDPAAQRPDGSDAEWALVTTEIRKDQFEREYPNKTVSDVDMKGHGDDHQLWFSDDSVRIAEYWTIEHEPVEMVEMMDGRVLEDSKRNPESLEDSDVYIARDRDGKEKRRTIERRKVKWYYISGADVLESRDWPGKFIPIVRCVGDEIDIQGRLVLRSLIRDAKDPQRMYNYWSSAETEHIALSPLAPFIGTAEQFEGYDELWGAANRKPLPYLPYNPDPRAPGAPQRQPAAQASTGIMQAKLAVADDMKAVTGVYDASLGQRTNETSGRAIRQRQIEGDTSTFHFIDNLSRAIRFTGRILIDLIPYIYDTDRYVRLLWDDDSSDEARLVPGARQRPDEELQEIVAASERIADVTTGQYDITVSVGPSYQTKRQEAAETMMQFMQVYPQSAPLIGDLIAKNMDWPGSDDIAERLKKMLPPGIDDDQPQAPPQPDPSVMAEKVRLETDRFEAETKRQEAEREHMRELLKMEVDADLRAAELRLKYGTELERSELDAIVKLEQAMINAEQKDNAARAAQTQPIPGRGAY